MRRKAAYESPSRPRNGEPEGDAHGGLDDLQPKAEREALGVRNAVADERRRDRHLEQADVAGPERDDRRHVHEHEHEPGGRELDVDGERLHRQPDREQLAQPADELEDDGGGGRRPGGA